jgi:hypothetical protein
MKLPTQKKVLKEDVKGAGPWITPLLDTLNSFMEIIYQAMNRNITFRENIACQIKEITYKTPSTYPASVEQFRFISTLKTKATGVIAIQAYERSTYVPAEGPVYAPWVEDNGDIVLSTITGLEADKTYVIRLLVT